MKSQRRSDLPSPSWWAIVALPINAKGFILSMDWVWLLLRVESTVFLWAWTVHYTGVCSYYVCLLSVGYCTGLLYKWVLILPGLTIFSLEGDLTAFR